MKKAFKILILSFVIISYSVAVNAEDSTVAKEKEISFNQKISLAYSSECSSISNEQKEYLEKIVEFMKKNPVSIVRIMGHTDDRGTIQYQESKARLRAEEVLIYLLEQGIANNRIFSGSSGAREPIANNNSEEGRKLNRRVEITITKSAE